jgi:hypothetical protein
MKSAMAPPALSASIVEAVDAVKRNRWPLPLALPGRFLPSWRPVELIWQDQRVNTTPERATMSEPTTREVKLEIQLDEETAQGAYCNLAVVNHSDTEFVIDFVFVQPQAPRAKVRSRLITSPRHAKRLLLALQENLARYERAFGPVEPAAQRIEAADEHYH